MSKTWTEIEEHAEKQKIKQDNYLKKLPVRIEHPPFKDEGTRALSRRMDQERLKKYKEDSFGKVQRTIMHLCKFCSYLDSFVGGAAITKGACTHCGETGYYESTHMKVCHRGGLFFTQKILTPIDGASILIYSLF